MDVATDECNSFDPPEMQITDPRPSPMLNPLLVDTVLRCVFSYEPVGVLKQCRLVCQKWKLICDPFFMRKSMFVLTEDEKDKKASPQNNLEKTVKFPTLFKSIQKDIMFTAFKFQFNLLTKPAQEMYFEPNKQSMTQLVVHNPFSLDEDLENYNIDYLLGPSLNRLILTATLRHKIQVKKFLSVSLDKLSPIFYLDLYRCTIILTANKMAPKELKLASFQVEQNGRIAQYIPINELIDFRRLGKLYLKGFTGCGLGSAYIRYCLNLSDCTNIKDLTLIFIKINLDGKISAKNLSLDRCVFFRGGEEVKHFVLNEFLGSTHLSKIYLSGMFCSVKLNFEGDISVDKLKLPCAQIESSSGIRDRIKVINLEIEEIQVFDVGIVPPTVERLKIAFAVYGTNLVATVSNNVSNHNLLPNLKQLMLFESVCALSHFVNCNSLVDVALSPALRETTLVVNSIPRNIKRLLLLHNVNFEGDNILQLDVLALSGCHSSFTKFDITQLFTQLQPATLVFCNYGHYNSTLNDICEKSVEIILNLKKILSGNTIVAFGPVKWESEDSFQNSSLAKIVDQKAKYYQLNGLTAKVIHKTTFNDMIPFVEL